MAGRSSPKRSCRNASRWSPAIGDQHEDLQGEALVELLGDHGARSRVDHAKGRVDQVAVFGVFERQQGSVRGQRATVESSAGGAPQAHRLGAADQLLGGCSVDRGEHREPVAIADRRDDDPRGLREPLVPALGRALQEGPALATRERLDEPLPCLTAGLVLPVQDTLTVERRGTVDDAHGVIGHLPLGAGGHVPTVHLIDAALGALVDDAVGRRRRPVGHRARMERGIAPPSEGSLRRSSRNPTREGAARPTRAREKAAGRDGARRRG